MQLNTIALTVAADVEVKSSAAAAAALAAAIANAPADAAFTLELSAPTAAPIPIQLAEACRKSLVALGRAPMLGPHAAAVLDGAVAEAAP